MPHVTSWSRAAAISRAHIRSFPKCFNYGSAKPKPQVCITVQPPHQLCTIRSRLCCSRKISREFKWPASFGCTCQESQGKYKDQKATSIPPRGQPSLTCGLKGYRTFPLVFVGTTLTQAEWNGCNQDCHIQHNPRTPASDAGGKEEKKKKIKTRLRKLRDRSTRGQHHGVVG